MAASSAVDRLSNLFGDQLVSRSFRPEEGATYAYPRDTSSDEDSGSDAGPKKPDFDVAPEEVRGCNKGYFGCNVQNARLLRPSPTIVLPIP